MSTPNETLMDAYGTREVFEKKADAAVPTWLPLVAGAVGAYALAKHFVSTSDRQAFQAEQMNELGRELELLKMAPPTQAARHTSPPILIPQGYDVPVGMDQGMVRMASAIGTDLAKEAMGLPTTVIPKAPRVPSGLGFAKTMMSPGVGAGVANAGHNVEQMAQRTFHQQSPMAFAPTVRPPAPAAPAPPPQRMPTQIDPLTGKSRREINAEVQEKLRLHRSGQLGTSNVSGPSTVAASPQALRPAQGAPGGARPPLGGIGSLALAGGAGVLGGAALAHREQQKAAFAISGIGNALKGFAGQAASALKPAASAVSSAAGTKAPSKLLGGLGLGWKGNLALGGLAAGGLYLGSKGIQGARGAMEHESGGPATYGSGRFGAQLPYGVNQYGQPQVGTPLG